MIRFLLALTLTGTQPGGGAGLGIKCPANQAVTQIAPGNSQCGPAGGSSSLTCPAGQFVQQLTNGPDGGNCANPSAQSGWTLIDCNLTIDPTQTFNTDGLYTVCGKNVTFKNTEMSSPHMFIYNPDGGGLFVGPADAGTFYFANPAAADFINAPRMQIKLSDWVPGYTSDMPIEVGVYCDRNGMGASFNEWFVSIQDQYGPSTRDGAYYLPEYVNAGNDFDTPSTWFFSTRHQAPSASSANGFTGSNTHKITLPNGVAGGRYVFWNNTQQLTTPTFWPTWAFLVQNEVAGATDFDTVTYGMPANPDGNEVVEIGCAAVGATTLPTCKFYRISIWYKAR